MSTDRGDDEPKADGAAPAKAEPTADTVAATAEAPGDGAPGEPSATGAAETDAEAAADSERDPWPFDFESGEPAELSFAGDEDLTLDAFERAVSRAVHDKLGAASADADAPRVGGPPRGADELVASVLGALTGKDARSALDEVRSQLASGPPRPDGRGADVIDLQAVREARKRQAPSDFSLTVGDALKETFNAYLAQVAQRSGRAEFTIDADFLKTHGPTLLGNLFQGLAQSLLPQMAPPKARPPVAPAAPREAEAGDDGDAGGADVTRVASDADPARAPSEGSTPEPEAKGTGPTSPSIAIKVDLGSILANLFKRRPPSR